MPTRCSATASACGSLEETSRTCSAPSKECRSAAGVGTVIADGGMPLRYGPEGEVHLSSPLKEA
ncbi:hypothetical protein [Streptomyces sp. NBC_00414]|uniref:hypothetical protein n=1 Tax=Streptomyces sp. NBC_00414 TaxID=2975739 RepID=UPI003FA6BE89